MLLVADKQRGCGSPTESARPHGVFQLKTDTIFELFAVVSLLDPDVASGG